MRVAIVVKTVLVGANIVLAAVVGRAPWYDVSAKPHPAVAFPPTDSSSDPVGLTGILRRAEPSCGCIKKCARKNWHIDSQNCARCLPCPEGQIAESKSNYKRCTKNNEPKDDDKKKRRKAKEDKWPAVKKIMVDKFKDREPKRKERQDRRKLKRLGLCTIVAPFGVDWHYMKEVVDEFFDEDYLGSGDMLKHWPEDLVIEEWELDTWNDDDEETFYQDDRYLDPWVAHVNETRPLEIQFPWPRMKRDADANGGHGVVEVLERRGIQKRFLQAIVSIIRSFAGKVGKGGRGKGGGGGGLKSAAMPKFKIGRRGGKGKRSAAEQSAKIKDMLDKGPMRWCLERRTPTNHR